jgi:hypothetical protein
LLTPCTKAGRAVEAERWFHAAEQMQAERQPGYPFLYSLSGFQYCDLSLAVSERAAWRQTLKYGECLSFYSETLHSVGQLATKALQIIINGSGNLVGIALNRLTLGRATLYAAVLSESGLLHYPEISQLKTTLNDGVNGFRRAGTTHHLPRGLLTRSWLRFLTGARTGHESAQEDLDEAWEIAERGPMRLHMADIHLYRARLFFREEKYPWESAQKDLEEAERLINECGYHRRDEELADAKRVILNHPR